MMELTRRQLFRTASAAVAGAVVADALTAPTPTPSPTAPNVLVHKPTENTFAELRQFAATRPEVRAWIDNRKNAVLNSERLNFKWSMIPLDVRRTLESPDRQRNLTSWLSCVLEDMIVLDAVAIYHRDGVWSVLDGANVVRYLDQNGIPEPPAPAFEYHTTGHLLRSTDPVNVQLTSSELLYVNRNRPHCTYGYSEIDRWLDAQKGDYLFLYWGGYRDVEWAIDLLATLVLRSFGPESAAMFRAAVPDDPIESLGDRYARYDKRQLTHLAAIYGFPLSTIR